MRGIRLFIQTLVLLGICLSDGIAQDSTQWNLPEGATARIGKGTINAIKLSSDKTLLAVAGSAGIWLYDANTGTELALLRGHTRPVSSVAFSPYGDILASGSYDGKIHLWNPQTRQLLRTLNDGGKVASVIFSPDGRTLANVSGKTVRLWDVHTGDSKASFGNHTSSLASVIFSPDGRTAASEDTKGNVELWDAQTGVLRAAIDTERGYSTSMEFSPGGYTLAFSPDGTLLASTLETTIRLLDANTGEEKVTLEGHTDFVLTAAFSADSATLVSASRDKTIRLWDTRTGENIAKQVGFLLTPPVPWYLAQPHRLRLVEFLSDGEMFASADGHRGEIRIADTNTGEIRTMLTGFTAPITSMALSADGTTLASVNDESDYWGKWDRKIQLWNIHTGHREATLRAKNPAFHHAELASFSSISFSPDGLTLAGGSGSATPTTIFLWDVQTQQLKTTFESSRNDYQQNSIAFSPDGQTLAWGSNNGKVRLWNVQTGQPKMTLWGHIDIYTVQPIVFSPNGEVLASGHLWDGDIRLWDAETGTHQATLTSDDCRALAFSPDGATLASTGTNGASVQLWDIATKKLKTTLNSHLDERFRYENRGQAVAFSPDGSTLASASADSSIHIWNAETGERKETLKGHTNGITSLAFSPDGRTLVSGSLDGTKLLWEMNALPMTRVYITPRFAEAPPIGKEFAISIRITDGRNITGYQFTVNFDPAALRYGYSHNGDYFPRDAFATPSSIVNQNSVTLAGHAATGMSSGNGKLATIFFEVTARTASTLTLSDVVLTDSEGKQVVPLTDRGWIGAPPPLSGDVNSDGRVDAEDLGIIASRLGQPGEGNSADVNEDGVVDIADLVWLTRRIQSDAPSTD